MDRSDEMEAFVFAPSAVGNSVTSTAAPSKSLSSSSSNVVVRETRHGSSFRVVTSAEAKPQPSLVFRHNSQWNGGYPGLGKTEKTLLWFRNDLRLADNPCVDFAMRKSSTLLPVYCFDPRCFEEDERELSRTSVELVEFLVESVKALKAQLKQIGSDLLIKVGKPETVIPALCTEYSCSVVVYQQGFTRRNVIVEEQLAEAMSEHPSVSLRSLLSNTLFDAEKLPFKPERCPQILSDFRDLLEKSGTLAEVRESPKQLARLPIRYQGSEELPTAEQLCKSRPAASGVDVPRGGEADGLKVLRTLMEEIRKESMRTDTQDDRAFRTTVEESITNCMRPWLRFGCVSPSRIYSQLVSVHPQEGLAVDVERAEKPQLVGATSRSA